MDELTGGVEAFEGNLTATLHAEELPMPSWRASCCRC